MGSLEGQLAKPESNGIHKSTGGFSIDLERAIKILKERRFKLGDQSIENVKIEDLEAALNICDHIENEVVISDGKDLAVYVGEAFGLYFDEPKAIRGGARITKYTREKSLSKQPTIVRWFPPKVQIQEVLKVKDQKIWSIKTEYPYDYFISRGEITKGYAATCHYRGDIKVEAAKQGVDLSPKLFDLVFGPIDNKIFKMYQAGQHFGIKERK